MELKNISKTFYEDNKSFKALNGVNLKINKGEILGFLGANGAGKTTTIKAMANLIKVDEGDVLYDGESIVKNSKLANKKIGVLLEGSRNLYYFLTVRENLKYFSLLNGVKEEKFEKLLDRYIKFFGMENKLDVPVNELSRGMKQKVSIINLLIKDSEMIILDEPTLGLDIISKYNMISILKKLASEMNKTVIICSHDAEVIESTCDRVVVFEKGTIIADKEMRDIKNVQLKAGTTKYKVILMSNESVRSIANKCECEILKDNEGTIELKCSDITEILKLVNERDILEIQTMGTDLSQYIQGVLGYEFD